MKAELVEKLCAKYPEIFGNLTNPSPTSIPYPVSLFSIECGDGWYNIIDCLCGNIKSHIEYLHQRYKADSSFNKMQEELKVGDYTTYEITNGKWIKPEYRDKTVANILEQEPRKLVEPLNQVKVLQVKEKFGGLRFYIDAADDIVYAYIRFAESMSYRTCEECGKPGRSYTTGWVRTLCPEHAREFNYDESDQVDVE